MQLTTRNGQRRKHAARPENSRLDQAQLNPINQPPDIVRARPELSVHYALFKHYLERGRRLPWQRGAAGAPLSNAEHMGIHQQSPHMESRQEPPKRDHLAKNENQNMLYSEVHGAVWNALRE
jgi:hypothetical protein